MASKTYAQLSTTTSVLDADLLATYSGTGPLKAITAGNFWAYIQAKVGALFAPLTRQVATSGLATGGGDLSADRTITVPSASASTVRTGTSTTAAMTVGDTYSAFAEVTLTDVPSGTVAVDLSTFVNAYLPLTGSSNTRTLGNPTNPKVGQNGWIRPVQSASGGNSMSFGSYWKRQGGAASLSTAANATDVLEYQVITPTYILYDLKVSPS